MVLFLLLLLIKGADNLNVQQFPSILIENEGNSLILNCQITGYDTPRISWYRQFSQTEMTLLFSSFSAGSVEPTSLDRFTAKRPNASHLILESAALAFYFL